MSIKLNNLKKYLSCFSDFEKAKILQGFFKTKKGEYGEGDIFIGVTVPNIRKVAKAFSEIELNDIKMILYSKIHEERLCALLILVEKFNEKDPSQIKTQFDGVKKEIFYFYVKNTKQINNWDLVDLSAPKIVGEYLIDKKKDILYKFAVSKNLWEKRISIISTYTFIKNNYFEDTFKIAEILMNDKHDLIHKAVGWMLREVGKRSLRDEENFLKKYSEIMPRTMLRYAIEKFPEEKRLKYLNNLF
jgi:3-methyladenine DNA glycosylase AlkD